MWNLIPVLSFYCSAIRPNTGKKQYFSIWGWGECRREEVDWYWILSRLFKDIEIFYWTVLDVGWFCDTIRNQSTSETKIRDKHLVDNSRTAHFSIFGNYFSVRKSAWTSLVLFLILWLWHIIIWLSNKNFDLYLLTLQTCRYDCWTSNQSIDRGWS